MAEIGLGRFAEVAMGVAQAALPPSLSEQVLQAPVHPAPTPGGVVSDALRRLDLPGGGGASEGAGELREALGLGRVPDDTTLYRFLRRLRPRSIAEMLAEVIRRLPPPPPGGTTVAVDATGLAPGAISPFFMKRAKDQGNGFPWRHHLKWLIAGDVSRQTILAQVAKQGPANDSATLRPLVKVARPLAPLRCVLADAECDSERNHQYIHRTLKAESLILAKRGKKTWQMRGLRAQMHPSFPQALYRHRALAESVFSAIKRKLSARAPGRSLSRQCLQALLAGPGLSHLPPLVPRT